MEKYPLYLISDDVYYPSVLNNFCKKKGSPLQPLFEAFTNSIEAIEDKSKGNIEVIIYLKKDLLPDDSNLVNYNKITIKDNGIGLNDFQFSRLKMLRDSRKGPANRGTGRIQYIHYFENTTIISIYKDDLSGTGYKQKTITLSKSTKFLRQNSIIRIDNEEEIESHESGTIVTFFNPIEKNDEKFYEKLNASTLKIEFIRHYLALFCEIRKNLPKILIKVFINDKEDSSEMIKPSDIPNYDKTSTIQINYSKIENNKIVLSEKKETFELKMFKLATDKLDENAIKMVSKGEIAREILFDGLLPKESVNGDKYLFLLSSDYIDKKDADERGQIKLLDSKEFINQYKNYLHSDNDDYKWTNQNDEEILLSDIENITNDEILKSYPEIKKLRDEKTDKIDELKRMFLLNSKAISDSKIKINDTYEDILRKVYQEEARLVAQKDALFREHFQKIKKLTPDKDNYQNELGNAVSDFVNDIPASDKISLAKYVARRRLVLNIFNNILNNEEKKVQLGGRIDEKVLHNLIFQQTSKNTENSDLWLINEEFIYFKGVSDKKLSVIEFEGKNIIKDDKELTKEQLDCKYSLGENRLDKKPDILLFPNEGKCIIIEFKAPETKPNASVYVNQIDYYASLIRNFSIDEIKIDTFYGFLIGESLDDFDVRSRNHRIEHSFNFDYWFRPSEKVQGFFGRSDGSIYLEILKYSTLLARAKERNKIYMKKLGIDIDYDNFKN
jgi:hypothetical protein